MRTERHEGVTGADKGVTPSLDVTPSQLRQTPGVTGYHIGCEQWDGGACPHRYPSYVLHTADRDAHGTFILAGDTVHSKTHTGAAQALWALTKGAGGCSVGYFGYVCVGLARDSYPEYI